MHTTQGSGKCGAAVRFTLRYVPATWYVRYTSYTNGGSQTKSSLSARRVSRNYNDCSVACLHVIPRRRRPSVVPSTSEPRLISNFLPRSYCAPRCAAAGWCCARGCALWQAVAISMARGLPSADHSLGHCCVPRARSTRVTRQQPWQPAIAVATCEVIMVHAC